MNEADARTSRSPNLVLPRKHAQYLYEYILHLCAEAEPPHEKEHKGNGQGETRGGASPHDCMIAACTRDTGVKVARRGVGLGRLEAPIPTGLEVVG